nr:hypothetical protein CFP56_75567 [Quercus suber]
MRSLHFFSALTADLKTSRDTTVRSKSGFCCKLFLESTRWECDHVPHSRSDSAGSRAARSLGEEHTGGRRTTSFCSAETSQLVSYRATSTQSGFDSARNRRAAGAGTHDATGGSQILEHGPFVDSCKDVRFLFSSVVEVCFRPN